VAVVLDYDLQRGKALVDSYFETMPDRPLITVSPSAVIFEKCEKNGDAENFHVQSMVRLCQDLLDAGFAVLLVPHTFHPAIHIPTQCDYSVCLEILARMRPNRWLSVIHSDISAVDLKSVIANAHIHIGARYHSVVAGLSTGVPSISVSWHHKYGDIMEMYGVRDLVVDGNEPTFNEHTLGLVAEIRSNYDEMVGGLRHAQNTLADQIADNAKHFASLFGRAGSNQRP
jgi:polysaccharide pyruvyl transferase WcaK-like protein